MIVADELVVKTLTQSPKIDKHAKQRAKERYGMTPVEFGEYISRNYRHFEYVTITCGYGGVPGRMFVYEGKTFIFRLNENYLQTTYPADNKKSKRYSKRVVKKLNVIIAKEVRRYELKESKQLRELTRYQAELERELSEVRQLLTRVRSTPKIIACRARIAALELRIAEIPEEIAAVRIDKMRNVQSLIHSVGKGW